MQYFHAELAALNDALASFNAHLSPTFHVPPLFLGENANSSSIVKVVHGDWNAFPFPNNGTRGVYFIFGHERTKTETKGLYIGKASFGSKTSNRLHAHLHRHRKAEHFVFAGYNNETYIVDYIASIDLDKLAIPFMAPALEEYLITKLTGKLNLLNGTGNTLKLNQIQGVAFAAVVSDAVVAAQADNVL